MNLNVGDPRASYIDGVPTPEQVTAGMEVARELRERYRVRGVLVSAAQAGYIAELKCGMEYCFAAAQDRFEPLGIPHGPWMPTHEHFPLAKRLRGTRDVTNAVPAIQAAIDDHVEQRKTAAGRYPRRRGSRKRAIKIAHQTHESLGRTE